MWRERYRGFQVTLGSGNFGSWQQGCAEIEIPGGDGLDPYGGEIIRASFGDNFQWVALHKPKDSGRFVLDDDTKFLARTPHANDGVAFPSRLKFRMGRFELE